MVAVIRRLYVGSGVRGSRARRVKGARTRTGMWRELLMCAGALVARMLLWPLIAVPQTQPSPTAPAADPLTSGRRALLDV